MTPAERLNAAADLLEKRAKEVAAELNRSTHSEPWISIAYAHAEPFSTYIATMHPEVGKAVAGWLRQVAARADEIAGTTRRGWDSARTHGFVAANVAGWADAMTLADLLLAGES